VLVATLLGCAPIGASGSPGAAPDGSGAPASVDLAAAEAYCIEQGGELVDRIATSNTNADPSAQLPLAGRLRLCEFETVVEGDQEATRISVDLVTLYSEAPTLAAIAYLSRVPTPNPPTVGQNPAAYDCDVNLLGTSAFGNTDLAGGWVDASQPVFDVMQLCLFADGSTIDQFGIWYYANDIVRGTDLAPILRYEPGPEGLPAIYERHRP
jgi:hypothetical protein